MGGEGQLVFHWNSFQLYDDAFCNKGTHTIKFGFATERMQLGITGLSDPNGIFHFNDLQTFYANQPTRFQGGIVSTLSPRNLRQTIFVGGYIQDDWRWKPNVTFNLGLRYEMTTVPTETAGQLSVLRNLSDATPHLGDPFFNNPTTKNFEPRVGFAWDPFRKGKMAIRGGSECLMFFHCLINSGYTPHSVPHFSSTPDQRSWKRVFSQPSSAARLQFVAWGLHRAESETQLRDGVQLERPVSTYADTDLLSRLCGFEEYTNHIGLMMPIWFFPRLLPPATSFLK